MDQNEVQIEIDIVGLFNYLKKRAMIILLIALACGIAGFLYAEIFVKPVYIAETRLYVLNRSDSAAVQSNDFQLSNHILKDCQVLITGKNVTKEVIEQLNLDMSPNVLRSNISVTAPGDTRVLQIAVKDEDQNRAAAIANKVCEVAAQQIQNFTAADAVHQLYQADVPSVPSDTNVKRYTLLSTLVGFLVAVGIMTMVFLLDDSIRTEEDAARYLNLNVLGVIPDSRDIDSTSGEKTGKRKRPVFKAKNYK